jgi:hypothetical protein
MGMGRPQLDALFRQGLAQKSFGANCSSEGAPEEPASKGYALLLGAGLPLPAKGPSPQEVVLEKPSGKTTSHLCPSGEYPPRGSFYVHALFSPIYLALTRPSPIRRADPYHRHRPVKCSNT